MITWVIVSAVSVGLFARAVLPSGSEGAPEQGSIDFIIPAIGGAAVVLIYQLFGVIP
jgi:uncharacterized membrane protein YeaQ/YmgE (transglycosylase-associated protein family)